MGGCVRDRSRAVRHAQSKPSAGGWTLPPDADTLKNPLTVDDKVIATGKAVFKDKCEKCHGPRVSATVPTRIPTR